MQNEDKTTSTNLYKEAGVDIDKGNSLVDIIKPIAKRTSRLGANVNLGSFGGLFDLAACKYNDPVLVAANDGVGTKLKIAFDTGNHSTIGIDLVAMCVNDLIVQGAEPLFFLDYFATGGLELEIAATVIDSIAKGCEIAGCALIGGETAEMPGIYQKGHYDLAGFAVGAVERAKILPKEDKIKQGDVILGLASSGIHSNGYSLVRHVIAKNAISYSDYPDFTKDKTVGELLLTPTRIYVKSCLEVFKTEKVKALAHITGGGFIDNIPRVLPENLAATIDKDSFEIPAIFKWLKEIGKISMDEMYRTFNCGIGMIIVVAAEDEKIVKQLFEQQGETVFTIGEITEFNNKDRVIIK